MLQRWVLQALVSWRNHAPTSRRDAVVTIFAFRLLFNTIKGHYYDAYKEKDKTLRERSFKVLQCLATDVALSLLGGVFVGYFVNTHIKYYAQLEEEKLRRIYSVAGVSE